MSDEKAGELERVKALMVKMGLMVTDGGAVCGDRGSGLSRVQVWFWPAVAEPWTVVVGDPPGPAIRGRGVGLLGAIADARAVADMVLEHETQSRGEAAIQRAVQVHRVQVAALQELEEAGNG